MLGRQAGAEAEQDSAGRAVHRAADTAARQQPPRPVQARRERDQVEQRQQGVTPGEGRQPAWCRAAPGADVVVLTGRRGRERGKVDLCGSSPG